MKNQTWKRLFAMFLTVSVSVSLLVGLPLPASAATSSVNIVNTVYAFLCDRLGIPTLGESLSKAVDFTFDCKDQVSPGELYDAWKSYNDGQWFRHLFASYPDEWETLRGLYSYAIDNCVPDELRADLVPDSAQNNIMRPMIQGVGWLTDKNGDYPYCSQEDWNAFKNAGMSTPTTPKPFDGYFRPTNSIRDSKKVSQKSYADMDATKADLANKYPNSAVVISTLKVGTLTCKVIRRLEEGPGERDWVWCDPDGRPYVYVDPDTQGAAQNWNYTEIQETTNNIAGDTQEIKEDIKQLIEINNDNGDTKVNVPVQIGPNEWSFLKMDVDNIVIDMSDNGVTYTVDSHDVTYNIENNYYEYNYYTYNFEYTYNNTYVTYIGSTAEYQPKEWALYYELPDGRSSADLTEEDIAGLSFQFHDVINYKRSATDTSLRALYHFDGNVDDASYWSGAHVWGAGNGFDSSGSNSNFGGVNNTTDRGYLQWDKGASITYMESNAFNGALYLDEKEHQFTVKLPSSLGTQDFTIQWRYYQTSATTTDHNENYVSVGGTKLLGWSEQFLYSLGTTKLSTGLSVGSWQELALVRDTGTLYIYHNGVKVGSASMSTVLSNELVFYLGSNSRAYSMIDELRVTNFPIVGRGNAYTPTAVPYDTNSVLVLPGGTGSSQCTLVSYIETSENSQWIDTGLALYDLENFRVDMKVRLSKLYNYNALLGNPDDNTWYEAWVTSSGQLHFRYANIRLIATRTLQAGVTYDIALVKSGSTIFVYIDGENCGSKTVTQEAPGTNMFLFGRPASSSTMKIYSAQVYANGRKVLNLAPCASGKSWGMYDSLQEKIYLSGGSGAFGGDIPLTQPVADEYYRWDTSNTPVAVFDVSQHFHDTVDLTSTYYGQERWTEGAYRKIVTVNNPDISFDGSLVTLRSGSLPWDFPFRDRPYPPPRHENDPSFANYYNKSGHPGMLIDLGDPLSSGTHYISGRTLALTFVGADMERYTVTTTVPADGHGSNWTASKAFSFGTIEFVYYWTEEYDEDTHRWSYGALPYVQIQLNANSTFSFRYIELTYGSPNTGHEFVSCVYDKTDLQPNTAAIQSAIPVRGYTVGGVRPTFPQRGDVWFPVEGSRISGAYIYNGQAWEAVNARWWTGRRWIPIYAFDLVTLADMWDVGSSTGEDVTPSITSDYGFWNWWKNAWNDFTAKLFPALGTGSGGGGSGSGTISDGSLPGEDEDDEEDSWSVFDLLKALKDGAWAIVKGTVKTAFGGIKGVVSVVTDIGGFFTAIGEVSDTINDFGG